MPAANPSTPVVRLERPQSLVVQVEQALRQAIGAGAFVDGRLPTEVELAEKFGVSRETVRRAAHVLEREGLLTKHRRRGTVLSGPTPPLAWTAESRLLAYVQADHRSGDESVGRGVMPLVLQGAIEAAGHAGYELVVRSAPPADVRRAINELLGRHQVRGLLLVSITEDKQLRRMGGRPLPCVLVDHDLHVPKTSSIRDDSAASSRLAVEHLVALGHRRIAYAHWNQAELNPWRLRGYREALRAARIPVRRAYELLAEITPGGARQLVDAWAALAPRPTAIVCFNNTLARFVHDALAGRGVGVPGQVSLVGCGGEEVSGLTSCQADWYDMGRRALGLMLRRLDESAERPVEHELVMPVLHARTTTAPPGE